MATEWRTEFGGSKCFLSQPRESQPTVLLDPPEGGKVTLELPGDFSNTKVELTCNVWTS